MTAGRPTIDPFGVIPANAGIQTEPGPGLPLSRE